jgi:DNA ligase-1
MKITKTMQPCDVNLKTLHYPVLVQPKFDGVKLVRFNDKLTGRSFKPLRNKLLNELCDNDLYNGFEGEVIVGANCYADNLCRNTTSVVNSFDKIDTFTWLVFDYITDKTIELSYFDRIRALKVYIKENENEFKINIHIVLEKLVENEEELLAFEKKQLDLGAEGIIIRDGSSLYKQGRVTAHSQEVMRLKRFVHEEGEILELLEGDSNDNEAITNELGRTERSTHQENMIPNGMVGSIIVRSLVDNSIDKIGAGCMTHEERKYYFENPSELIGKIAKYKHFPKGVKDKKRFPQFECLRMLEDM